MKKFITLLAVCGFLVSCATSGTPDTELHGGSELTLNPEPSFVEESSAEARVSDQVAVQSNDGTSIPAVTATEPTQMPELVQASEPAPVSSFAGSYTPPQATPAVSSRSDVGRYVKKSKSERKASKKIAKKSSSKKIAKKSAKESSKKSKVAKKLSKAQCKKIAKQSKKASKKELAMCKIEKRKSGKHVAGR